jgi:hypothetical protein
MAKIKNPDQIGMFEQGSYDSRLEIPRDLSDPIMQPPSEPEAPSIPAEGISVSLAERAVHLDRAFMALAHSNRLGGLQHAGAEDSSMRRKIEARYGDNTDRVVGSAHDKQAEKYQESKENLARALSLGSRKLVLAGLMTEDEAAKEVQEEFYGRKGRNGRTSEGFIEKYGNDRKTRVKHQRAQRSFQKEAAKRKAVQ